MMFSTHNGFIGMQPHSKLRSICIIIGYRIQLRNSQVKKLIGWGLQGSLMHSFHAFSLRQSGHVTIPACQGAQQPGSSTKFSVHSFYGHFIMRAHSVKSLTTWLNSVFSPPLLPGVTLAEKSQSCKLTVSLSHSGMQPLCHSPAKSHLVSITKTLLSLRKSQEF